MADTKPINLNTPDRINPIALRLRKAVSKIAMKSPTSVRMILDGYLPRISPSLADAGDSGFPVTVRAHRRDPERGTVKGRYDLVFFHVGNAIMAYYKSLADKSGTRTLTDKLEDRVAFIDAIARDGIEKFHVIGSDSVGYRLESKTVKEFKEVVNGLPHQEQQTTGTKSGKADGGGAGNKTGSPPLRNGPGAS